MTGTLDLNITRYSNMADQGARLGEGVITGVADQGVIIGQVYGIVMAVGALLVLIGAIFGIILFVLIKSKGVMGNISKKV